MDEGRLDEQQQFDLLAGLLRADLADIDAFLPALAAKLELGFPALCRVERRRKGLLSGERLVESLELGLGDERFRLARGRGAPVATRSRVVRGITLRNEELPLDEWIRELSRALSAEAAASGAGRDALARMLGAW